MHCQANGVCTGQPIPCQIVPLPASAEADAKFNAFSSDLDLLPGNPWAQFDDGFDDCLARIDLSAK